MKLKSVAISVLFLAAAGSAWAQVVAGLAGITGSVRDASGAVIPGARVVITNDAKGIRRALEANEAGVFNAPSLPPASGYTVTVSQQGFANWELKNFELLVGQTQNLNVTLDVATTATTVEVTSTAPLVSSANVGVAATVEQSQIDNLPINGRRVDSFVLLTPAVTEDGTFGLVSFRGIAGGNAFLTDGNDTTNSFYNENAGRTRISTQISQDAVQEFQVLSDGYSAEFGRAMGGVINTVTRSGSNDTHGTAYWFFRNRTLNATDRYANGINAPEWRHQAGGSVGGAIVKDKLFYFANFEGVDRNFPAINRITVSGLTDPTGNFIPAANCKATAAQCAAAIAFIQPQMNVVIPRSVSSYMGFGKFDWRPSERNSFSVDMNAMHWRSPHGIQTQAVLNSGNAIGNNGNSTVETRYGKASWTSIVTPNSVNELRYGWFKDRLSDPAAGDLWPSTGGLYINLQGATIGAAQAYPRTYPSEQRNQLADSYSWTHGTHAVKFGVDFQTTNDWMNQLYNGMGSYSYSSLTAFAKDFSGNTAGTRNYSNFTQTFGNPIHSFRTTDVGLFVQDVWKATQRLTLNYGLRYEKTFLPQPSMTDPNWPQTGRIPQTNKNFAPRFSLSYALGDKTVIRAGYGIFWARFHGNALDTLWLGNSLYQPNIYVLPTGTGAPVFPNVFTSATGLPPGSKSLYFASPDFHNPYTQQGNFTVERQLGHDLGLTASYIWSRGIGLFVQRDLNLGAPGPDVTYAIMDAAATTQVGSFTTPVFLTANKMDTRYSKILQVENGGQSWYNGLVLQLNKRLAHGFQAQVSYTWSHALDDADQQGASWNIGSNYLNSTFNGNYALDKGSSTLDQRHRAVVNWIWEPKFMSDKSALARFLVNGWQLSTITTLASAHPVSPTVTFSSGVSGVKLANASLNGSGGWNRVPFLPVGFLNVDQMYRVDARVARALPFGERVKASLMFEAFNVFNTQYNTAIQTVAYRAANGQLVPQANLGNGSQSQAFPDGTNARRMQAALRFTF